MAAKSKFLASVPATLILSLIFLYSHVVYSLESVFAVNCGGDSHTDIYGIRYKKDQLTEGYASDFGKSLIISRVPESDRILYQTERYHTTDFQYDIPIKEDGKYVLVLKFCEVYFKQPGGKVFDVQINGQVKVLENLDIFSKAGIAMAHDEYIPFRISGDELFIGGEELVYDGKITVEFLKGDADNPKINAIVVYKHSEDIPTLPPIHQPEEVAEDEGDIEDADTTRKFKKTSGPRIRSPYDSDESWFWPVTVVVALFLPIIFCLCRH